MKRLPPECIIPLPSERALARRVPKLLRRGGRAGGWAGMARPKPLYAITGFTTSNYYATPNPGGEAGIGTGVLKAYLVRVARPVTGVIQMHTQRTDGATGGYQTYLSASGVLNAEAVDGGGVFRAAPTRLLNASDAARLHLIMLYLDGTKLRLWMDRAQSADGTACVGYTAYAGSEVFGKRAAYYADGTDLLAEIAARGTWTDAQLQTLFDVTRQKGDLPTAAEWPNGITHRWSVKDTLAGTIIVDGQTAPATLADTVTGAVADVMTRAGTPTVKVVDRSVDGRKTYGVTGMGTINMLLGSAPIIGASGSAFHFAWSGRIWSSATASRTIAGSRDLSDTTVGWVAWLNGTTLTFTVKSAAGSSVSLTYALPTAETTGLPVDIVCQYTGTVLQVFMRGVQVGSDTAITGYKTATSTAPLRLGWISGVASGADLIDHFQADGGEFSLTPAEILAKHTAWEATGIMPVVAGKTQHQWMLGADIIANGGPASGVPATVLDRIGTDHLTRVGGLTVGAPSGLTGFSASHWAQTAGVAAPGSGSGFYVECLANFVLAGSTNETLFSSGAFAWSSGWGLQRWNGYARFYMAHSSGGGPYAGISGATVAAGVHHMAMVYDGSVARCYLDGTLIATSGTVTYTASAVAAELGINRANYPADRSIVYGGAYGAFVPTGGEIATASAAAISAGKVVGVPAKFTKLWSVVDDVVAASGTVPPRILERVSGIEHMAVVGAPLQVAQRVERVWGWEAA
jgi:hypothetical protein